MLAIFSGLAAPTFAETLTDHQIAAQIIQESPAAYYAMGHPCACQERLASSPVGMFTACRRPVSDDAYLARPHAYLGYLSDEAVALNNIVGKPRSDSPSIYPRQP